MNVSSTDHWLETDGRRIFARSWMREAESGKPPILLFHDSLGCVELWRSFPPRLAEATGRRVLAYDRIGFGRSDPHPGVLGMDFVADEPRHAIPFLREGFGFERFVACGHSVGGGMAIEAAARYPGACEAVVTMGAQAFAENQTLDGIRVARERFASSDNLARLERYHGRKARWVVDAWTEIWLDARFRNWSLDTALSNVHAPVLAMHGDRDEYGSLAHPRRIAGTRGDVLVIPGSGHVLHREVEEKVVDAISGFLLKWARHDRERV